MEYFRRIKNWFKYSLGYTNLRPYYAFGHEILVGPETNEFASAELQVGECGDCVIYIDIFTMLLFD
jgi:hypothetical protein